MMANHGVTLPADQTATVRGQVRWLLARALWSSGRRSAAVSAAEKAEQELAADPEGARDRAAARTWLVARAQR